LKGRFLLLVLALKFFYLPANAPAHFKYGQQEIEYKLV
jgi:hypothetical protein